MKDHAHHLDDLIAVAERSGLPGWIVRGVTPHDRGETPRIEWREDGVRFTLTPDGVPAESGWWTWAVRTPRFWDDGDAASLDDAIVAARASAEDWRTNGAP